MTEQQLAAVKQALYGLTMLVNIEEAEPWQVELFDKTITALQSIISQDALHKMAEESRTSGLRLDDWDKIGCVNHDCDKCKAVQEPVAKVYRHGESSNGTPWHGIKWLDEGVNMPDGTLLYTTPPAAQPQFVLNGIDCSCGRKWRVTNNTLTASEPAQPAPVQVGTIGHIGEGKTTLTAAIRPVIAPAAQPAPDIADIIAGELKVSRGTAYDMMREALREASPVEPVAWEIRQGKTDRVLLEITNNPRRAHDWKCSLGEVVPLYAVPHILQREWTGLTDEDVAVVLTGDASLANRLDELTPSWVELTRAIETILKEKNT